MAQLVQFIVSIHPMIFLEGWLVAARARQNAGFCRASIFSGRTAGISYNAALFSRKI
jgi:hypothetical protein